MTGSINFKSDLDLEIEVAKEVATKVADGMMDISRSVVLQHFDCLASRGC
jgi:hypothetical protein